LPLKIAKPRFTDSLTFHDARENMLVQQVWGPLLSQIEMGNPAEGYVIDKIKHVTGHKSTTSIEAYDDRLSDDEQCDYSDGHEISQCILSHWSRKIPNARINLSPWNTC
jgi:cytochrome c peroxidase